ncbi:abc transporter [Ophiostoma piceae UAMH 11346]|uniref:Abc transporter n=1 Tax=Ophiostoma piceae (strain UAMH 11346) TaxID=1262450 RepID=S3BT72_OPHP1|nr:abc transporter [Ophiostoma piceae UAMH 11346]
MGKPGSSPLLRPDSDALSMHSQHASAGSSVRASAGSSSGVPGASRRAFLDDDDDAPELFLNNDDLPPLYSDVIEADLAAENADANNGPAAPVAAGRAHLGPSPSDYSGFQFTAPLSTQQPWRYCVTPFYSAESTKRMTDFVKAWSNEPPRPSVQLRGTHRETHERNGKNETRDVVDFDVKVDITPFLQLQSTEGVAWRTERTAENYETVHRGTVFRHQAPGVKGRPQLPHDLERGAQEESQGLFGTEAKPTLEEWCRRFCEDPSPLRSFTVRRQMTGFDHAKVKNQMEVLVRRTNYRGHLQVSFPVDDAGIVCYNDHQLNQWRIKRWIQVVCALTLVILFTWPYLFFRTKKYDVVSFDWAFSRVNDRSQKEYAVLSEDQWYNLWARAITKAVLSKRQGCLDQEDLRQAEGAEPTFESTGSTHVDGTLGYVRAGISALNQVNRQLGWGGDC